MNIFGSLHRRKVYLLLVLFITCAAFTADILDLREEIHILSCPYSSLDNNITTGVQGGFSFEPELIQKQCSLNEKAPVAISFMHLFPYGYRAPPIWS
jgi:hypothetical protein